MYAGAALNARVDRGGLEGKSRITHDLAGKSRITHDLEGKSRITHDLDGKSRITSLRRCSIQRTGRPRRARGQIEHYAQPVGA